MYYPPDYCQVMHLLFLRKRIKWGKTNRPLIRTIDVMDILVHSVTCHGKVVSYLSAETLEDAQFVKVMLVNTKLP